MFLIHANDAHVGMGTGSGSHRQETRARVLARRCRVRDGYLWLEYEYYSNGVVSVLCWYFCRNHCVSAAARTHWNANVWNVTDHTSTVRAMITENSTQKTQARAFSLFAFSGNVGIFLGPLIGL